MEFVYTINPSAETPIMLIDKHIGYDEVDGMGIVGSQFQRELLTLDEMGKKSISVWINSGGGSVMDGLTIAGAILFSKTKVDTYCMGIAASIAGMIFMCGRNRVIVEHGRLMMHPTSGNNSQTLKEMGNMIAVAISSRANKTVEEISKLMAKTTWINAETALSDGYATEIANNSDTNKLRKMTNMDEVDLMKSANLEIMEIVNSLKPQEKVKINNSHKMDLSKITNKLELVPEANEDAILRAIDAIQNKAKATEDDLTEKLNAANKLVEASAKELLETKNSLSELAKKQKEFEDKTKKAVADSLIDEAVKVGRITNNAEVIAIWKDKAFADAEGTKSLIESLPTNKNHAPLPNGAGSSNVGKFDPNKALNKALNKVNTK